MTKISVVIPTHKRSELLFSAIESVINQTEKNIEIIIVSDGKDDLTEEVVSSFIKEDDRVFYYDYLEPKGGNFARNYGVSKSIGDIIAFLDDDDTWNINKLEKQLQVLNSDEEIGLVYTGIKQIYPEKNIVFRTTPKHKGDLKKDILFRNYIGTTSTVLMRKSVFNEAGGFDVNLNAMQDYDLWIRVCQLCKVSFVDTPEVNYFNRSNSNQISVDVEKYRQSYQQIFDKYFNEFNKLTLTERKTIKSNHYKLLANKYNKNKNFKKSLEFGFKSLNINKTFKNLFFLSLMMLSFDTQILLRSMFNRGLEK